MQYRRAESLLVVHLEPGEDVFAALTDVVRLVHMSQGFVVSGIGHIHKVQLGYFIGAGAYALKDFPEGGELLSLTGNLAPKDGEPFFHLHAVLGRDDYSVFGGHLAAAEVDVTVEVMLKEVGGVARMRRMPEEATGLDGLKIE